MRIRQIQLRAVLSMLWGAAVLLIPIASGSPSLCDLSGYKEAPGLRATMDGKTLVVTWEGDQSQELRARFTINQGIPVIQDLAIQKKDGSWATLATNATPEFRMVSGYRRMDNLQYVALPLSGNPVTQGLVDQFKWAAFWDAPLNVPGGEKAHGGSSPPPEGIPGTDQPGLPRSPAEVRRATASYNASSCAVKTNGARLEISFPGVEMGIFAGRLQYTVYKGTNLLRQELIAKTDQDSVAYKYEAGMKGMPIQSASKLVWRDTANAWQRYQFGGATNKMPAVVTAANRLIAAESAGGSIAAFPPPHNFFWTREIEVNLGYDYYQKNGDSYSFGVREADSEADPAYAGRGAEDRRQNFALRNARPGTWQRMPVYFYMSAGRGVEAIDWAMKFTRNDHYKPLPGYWVMARHFHTSLVNRLMGSGGLDNVFPDFELAKAAGLNVFGPVDGGNGGADAVAPTADANAVRKSPGHVKALGLYYQAARLQSDKDFLVLPLEEIAGTTADNKAPGSLADKLGGHTDLLPSHPVYWSEGRTEGQPLVENDSTLGRVYHIGTPQDLIQMAHNEDMVLLMPHPRAKSSTGFPDAIKDTDYFKDGSYLGVGFRWAMDVDGSEQRLCDYRCMPLFDDMNNWVADLPTHPKYMDAITETYQKGPGDDFYANNPVTYVKVHGTPGLDNWQPIIDAMKAGDFFVTSGEVLINKYAVQGSGKHRTISADVEWTFPLEFAEVVWGDGQKTDRQIISLTDQPAFGTRHFAIPFDTTGRKWVRFAVWDAAGNGAFVQPIKLNATATSVPESGH
jgi:hypothetical protein